MFSSFSSEPIIILVAIYSTDLLIKTAWLKTSEKPERLSKNMLSDRRISALMGMKIYSWKKKFKELSLKTEKDCKDLNQYMPKQCKKHFP